MPYKAILNRYRSRRDAFDEKRRNRSRLARRISLARLSTFLLAAIFIVGGLGQFFSSLPLSIGFGVFFLLVFAGLVLWHDRVLRARDRYKHLRDINNEAAKRMERDWTGLPFVPVPPDVAGHPLAYDLDLFSAVPGGASLLQLLGASGTATGSQTLQSWLLTPAVGDEIPARQAAVKELTDHIDWRQEFQLRGKLLPTPPPDIDAFIEWAEAPPWLLKRKPLLLVARLLSGLPTIALVLNLVGLIPPWWILFAMFNLLFFGLFSRPCHANFELVSSRERAFRHYAKLFKLLAKTSHKSTKLQELKRKLTAHNLSAFGLMKRLDRLSSMADVRFSPMLYLPLQAMFLWSFYVLHGLERWQEKAGKSVGRWFDALGETEALLCLSGLAHDHPHWAFPTITRKTGNTVVAENLGHPLLHPTSCITNDITIGPSGTFQMITGSNMSGKSTLLRALGLNMVLAQAGGPVFATSLVMPPARLGTSFRIQDSLQAGVSFFMAELKRLKDIVDQARDRDEKEPGAFLYLLDEILQGTNVAERQVAVRSVVLTLLENNAIGAISTHDLSLAEAPGLEDQCQPFHFTETYQAGADGPSMHFDYTLRPGVAPTVNALKLLEIVGLKTD
ncbi:MAG: hypothetical protein GY762_09150 [Proteobacteria bacterium]|nr:hypothetical protein [Pseudomonadota bacterium]